MALLLGLQQDLAEMSLRSRTNELRDLGEVLREKSMNGRGEQSIPGLCIQQERRNSYKGRGTRAIQLEATSKEIIISAWCSSALLPGRANLDTETPFCIGKGRFYPQGPRDVAAHLCIISRFHPWRCWKHIWMGAEQHVLLGGWPCFEQGWDQRPLEVPSHLPVTF